MVKYLLSCSICSMILQNLKFAKSTRRSVSSDAGEVAANTQTGGGVSVDLVCVTDQSSHQIEGGPVQLVEGQGGACYHALVVVFCSISHTLSLGYDRRKPLRKIQVKPTTANKNLIYSILLEHVIIGNVRAFSSSIVLSMMAVLVTEDCDPITKNGAHFSWLGSSQIISYLLFCTEIIHLFKTS